MSQQIEEISLKDILIKLSDYKRYILKQKLMIILCSVLFLILSVLFVINDDKIYRAELTFIVENNQQGAGTMASMSGLASQFGFDFSSGGNTAFSQSNILELLKSRKVVEAALMRNVKINGNYDLFIEHYIDVNELREDWGEDIQLKNINFNKNITNIHDSIISLIWNSLIEEDLDVMLDSDAADIIKLSCFSLDQEFAKYFVEVLIDEMSQMYISYQTAQASNTLNFLQIRSDSVFSELEVAEVEFARVRDVNQRIVKASGRLKEIQLMRRVEVLNAMYLELIKNLELSKVALLNQTPIFLIIDTPTLPLDDENISMSLVAIISVIVGLISSISFFIFKKLFIDVLNN